MYKPGKTFKVSRSGIDSFMSCKKCFYLNKRKNIKDIGMPGFSLNSAVDELLKKEFDFQNHIRSLWRVSKGIKSKNNIVFLCGKDLYKKLKQKRFLDSYEPLILRKTKHNHPIHPLYCCDNSKFIKYI